MLAREQQQSLAVGQPMYIAVLLGSDSPQGSTRGVPVLDVHDEGAAVGGRNEQRAVIGAERQAGDG